MSTFKHKIKTNLQFQVRVACMIILGTSDHGTCTSKELMNL